VTTRGYDANRNIGIVLCVPCDRPGAVAIPS
jgi:hypothetical protein